jgi:outer membrane protein TolC
MSLDVLEIQAQQRQAIVREDTIKYVFESLDRARQNFANGEITQEKMIMQFNDYFDLLKKFY